MSKLSDEANHLIYQLLKQMHEMAGPPHKFDPSWCFITDDEDDLPESPPDDPYDLVKLTEWATETLSRGNRFRLWNYQLKHLSANIITYHYEEGQDPIKELHSFFSSNPRWSLRPVHPFVRLDFFAKIPLVKKLKA
jgi:hypothetical protein